MDKAPEQYRTEVKVTFSTKFGSMDAILTQGSHAYIHPTPGAANRDEPVTISGYDYWFSTHLYFRDGAWKVSPTDNPGDQWQATWFKRVGNYRMGERGPKSFEAKLLAAVLEGANAAITAEHRQVAHANWVLGQLEQLSTERGKLLLQIVALDEKRAQVTTSTVDDFNYNKEAK